MVNFLIFSINPEFNRNEMKVESRAEAINKAHCNIIASNILPDLPDIKIIGKAEVGEELTVSHFYKDTDKERPGLSTHHWYRADNTEGKNLETIMGAFKLSYTLTEKDIGKYIIFKVTPVVIAGVWIGKEMSFSTASAVVRKKPEYDAHIKLDLTMRRAYAKRLAELIKDTCRGDVITITKEGQYYRVSADFVDIESAIMACKAMMRKKYIKNYYIT